MFNGIEPGSGVIRLAEFLITTLIDEFFSGGRSQDYLEGVAIIDGLNDSSTVLFKANGGCCLTRGTYTCEFAKLYSYEDRFISNEKQRY